MDTAYEARVSELVRELAYLGRSWPKRGRVCAEAAVELERAVSENQVLLNRLAMCEAKHGAPTE